MNNYFNSTKVSDDELGYFQYLSLKYENMNGAIFVGHPFIIAADNLIMKCVIVCNYGIYYFYSNADELSIYKRFIMQQLLEIRTLSDRVIDNINAFVFGLDINNKQFELNNKIVLSDNEVNSIISIFQNVYNLVKKVKREVSSPNTIGSMIVERSNKEAVLDKEQFNFIYNDEFSDCNVRVRGLAGSGKTILLAKKMAYIHFKDNQKKMAYVFYTKSLKQSVDSFFVQFYKQFKKEPDEFTSQNIHIMHGWGTRQFPGLYSRVCKLLGIDNSQYSDLINFEHLCKNMINYVIENNLQSKIQTYDYIFIDEAQDFGIYFFKLAKMCLLPTGKLIYAYDELQVLNDLKSGVPSEEEIFGEEKCEEIDLPDCYRTPLEILVTAHALGLGIYHYNDKNELEMINVVQDKTVWRSIGYFNKKGGIKGGKEVSLYRNQLISNPLGDSAVLCKISSNYLSQCEYVIKEIDNLITTQDVLPEDILIIDLDSRSLNEDYALFMKYLDNYFTEKKNVSYEEERPYDINIVNKDSGYSFKEVGKVSFTTIYRAKGNEANIVFVINSNNNDAILTYNRNRIFTAMTRAKFKVYLCGSGQLMNDLVKEIEEVKKHEYRLDFIYPTKEEIKKHKSRIYKDNKLTKVVDDLFNELDERGSESISNELYDILMSKFSEKEREAFLERLVKDEKEQK